MYFFRSVVKYSNTWGNGDTLMRTRLQTTQEHQARQHASLPGTDTVCHSLQHAPQSEAYNSKVGQHHFMH